MRSMLKAVSTATVLGLGLMGTGARAADIMYSGNFCHAALADLTRVEHAGQHGVHNVSGVTATVQCPFNPPFFAKVEHVMVTVYDRHPSLNIDCTLRGLSLEGNVIWSETRSSAGSGPNHQFIVFDYGSGQTTHTLNMTCTLPPVFGGSLSHLVTYRVIHTP